MTPPPPGPPLGPPSGPPPYGPPARGRIRGARVAIGIGIALAAHALTVAVMVVSVAVDSSELPAGAGVIALLVGQVIVFLGCLIAGVVLVARQESGIGVGLLIGWAVGVLAAPAAGFGLCVWLLSGSSA